MHRLYAKTTPFYIRDLSVRGFWYPKGDMEPVPYGYVQRDNCTTFFIHFVHDFVYPSIDGHLHCFHLLAIGNNAPMNMGVQMPI